MELCLADILAAQRSIRERVVRTPLVSAPSFSARAEVPFHLKMETLQPTGAFKLRGAANAAGQAPDGTHTLVCCSTGNHGRAVAHAARELGMKAIVCMSALVPRAKVEAIRALGAEIRIVGHSQDEAMEKCRRLAEGEGVLDIPPFDDPFVIAGQGTVGLEILEDVPDLTTLLIPLSGGGLAAGVALAARAIKPDIRLIGISMDRGAAMKASLDAGRPVDVEEVESLADSLGGGIGLDNRLSFPMCRDLLDNVVLVSEAEIYRGMQALYFEERHIAEGASVVGIAALLAGKLGKLTGPTATILTGRSVDMGEFTKVITGQDIHLGNFTLEGRAYGA